MLGEKKIRVLIVAFLCACLTASLIPAVPAATTRVNTGPVNITAVNVSMQVTHTIQPVITGRVAVVTTRTTVPRVTIRETIGRVPAEIGNQAARVTPTPSPSALPTIRKAGTDLVADIPAREIRNLPGSGVNATGKAVANLSGRDSMGIAGAGVADLATRDRDALIKGEIYETRTGIENPVTGEVISPGEGNMLPGGLTMPGAEDRWNDRPGGAGGVLGGGKDWTGEGTPFNDNPLGNPMDDFLNGHGGNLPDPMDAFGRGRPVISSAEGGDQSGGDYSYLICGSDFLAVENQKSGKDECIIIEVVGGEITQESWSDFKELSEVWDDSGDGKGGSGTQGQQYEGEGGYTGGTGGSANDLTFGGARRGMGGIGSGGAGTDEDGLAYDTGGKVPVVLQKVGEYIARGGKLRGKGGYQPGDSGLGQDSGSATNRIAGLKKALDAQRFVIDADATSAERVPWWLEKKVSPGELAAVSQANAASAAGAPAAAAQGAGQAQAQGQ